MNLSDMASTQNRHCVHVIDELCLFHLHFPKPVTLSSGCQ